VNTPPRQSIVLVDDEKSYMDLMTQLLADHLDCPVHGFTRPLAALDALPALSPGVIVTDYFMPQLNGIDFIRQAAPLVPASVFVMITGNNLEHERATLDALAPLKGFLPKPFGWRRLADEILRVWPATSSLPPLRGAPVDR
jgi:CheY-like chemotaxis protein